MRKLLLTLVLVFCIGFSSASYISMSPTVEFDTIVEGNQSVANFTLINSGDEPAYDVFTSLMLDEGFRSNDLLVGVLYPDDPYNGEFVIEIDESVTPGVYSIPLMVDYKDANGYPFSAVSTFSFNIQEAVFSRVTLRVDELTLSGTGAKDLRLKVKNIDERAHMVSVRLFLPRELSSDSEEKSALVDGKSESEPSFRLSSSDALPGSSYIVSAVASYEEDGLHYSSYSNGVVHVVEEKPLPSWIPAAALAFLVFLIMLFIIYQFRK